MTQQFRYVAGHIEVYSEYGEFLFSADTMQEAWEELGCMLKLHTLAEWMYGFLEPAPPYGLPEEMYNDVMPSGVHRYNRYNDGL